MLLVAPILISITGCSQLQTVVGDGARQVTASAAAVATAELTRQICTPITDGSITTEDQARIAALLSAAESAGVAEELVASMQKITGSGAEPSASDVSAFMEACAEG